MNCSEDRALSKLVRAVTVDGIEVRNCIEADEETGVATMLSFRRFWLDHSGR